MVGTWSSMFSPYSLAQNLRSAEWQCQCKWWNNKTQLITCTLIHWIIHSVSTHWLSVFLVLSWELGNRHGQDLDPDTPFPAPALEKAKGRCCSAVRLRGVSAEQIQSQNSTDVPRPFELVSILRASPAQAPQSPGDDIGPFFCWRTDIGFLRWKRLKAALAYWVECGKDWYFLLFSKVFEGRWDDLRLKPEDLLGLHEIRVSSLAGWDSVERGVCAACAFTCDRANVYFGVYSQKKQECPLTLDAAIYTFCRLSGFRIVIFISDQLKCK